MSTVTRFCRRFKCKSLHICFLFTVEKTKFEGEVGKSKTSLERGITYYLRQSNLSYNAGQNLLKHFRKTRHKLVRFMNASIASLLFPQCWLRFNNYDRDCRRILPRSDRLCSKSDGHEFSLITSSKHKKGKRLRELITFQVSG